MKKISPKSMPQKAPSHAPAHVMSPRCRVLGFFFPCGHETVAASTNWSSCCFCRLWASSSPWPAPSGLSYFRTTIEVAIAILRRSWRRFLLPDIAAPVCDVGVSLGGCRRAGFRHARRSVQIPRIRLEPAPDVSGSPGRVVLVAVGFEHRGIRHVFDNEPLALSGRELCSQIPVHPDVAVLRRVVVHLHASCHGGRFLVAPNGVRLGLGGLLGEGDLFLEVR